MTLGISDAQLNAMRAQVAQLLPGTAVIRSVSLVSDGAGGNTPTWAAVTGGTVACRVDPLGSSKRGAVAAQIGRETLSALYQLTVPFDAPVAENRQAVIAGRTYEIVQLDDVHSWNVSRRAVIAEVR